MRQVLADGAISACSRAFHAQSILSFGVAVAVSCPLLFRPQPAEASEGPRLVIGTVLTAWFGLVAAGARPARARAAAHHRIPRADPPMRPFRCAECRSQASWSCLR